MKKKYLLYIDILGFSEIVKKKNVKVIEIYNIIDELNVHRHHAFNTIVFSDTIIIYNKYQLQKPQDHRYFSMYLCEFAQDLLYRFVGKDIYFRAILDYGEFEHKSLKNIECFFGETLINCYNLEKKIPSIGLFITESAARFQSIFKMKKFDDGICFVFLQQYLESFVSHFKDTDGDYNLLIELDLSYPIVREIRILEDVYKKMNWHPTANIRSKYATYWNVYKQMYPWPLNKWESNNFSMNDIIISEEWEKIYKDIYSE
ncbi:MAG: hypothetical protein KAT34_22060 [Candidatus Aminicenantes bacterium]|nr:hypothetical protein [Candidatus Aminicenantes bacterium]